MSFNLRADQCPLPIAPTTLAYRSAATGTTVPIGNFPPITDGGTLFAQTLNQMLTDIANGFLIGGNGYGVYQGLNLSTTTGLNVPISAGMAVCKGIVNIPNAVAQTLPNTATSYVWLKPDGTTTYTASTTPPVTDCVYLGQAVTAGGNVTAVDMSGVCYIKGGQTIRYTADRGFPRDSPPSALTILTKTGAGSFLWDGAGHQAQGEPYYAVSTGSDLQLDQYDVEILQVTATGGNRKVKAPSTPRVNQIITLLNSGTSNNVLFTDPTGATTLATLTPGQMCGPRYTQSDPGTGAFKFSTHAADYTVISPA